MNTGACGAVNIIVALSRKVPTVTYCFRHFAAEGLLSFDPSLRNRSGGYQEGNRNSHTARVHLYRSDVSIRLGWRGETGLNGPRENSRQAA